MGLMNALQELEPHWKGPWHEDQLNDMPGGPGVFCICACLPEDSPQRYRLLHPVFIGTVGDLRAEIIASDDWDRWRALAGPGSQLCVGFLPAPPGRQETLEGAMIAYYRPPGNQAAAGAWASA